MSSNGDGLKLAVVTDIHHGRTTRTKMGPEALGLLNRFVDFANEHAPDLVIDLGDRISDLSPEEDRALTADVAGVFQRVGVPRRHLLGNHDFEHMSRADGEAALGAPLASESIDLKGFHLVFWQADTSIDATRGFRMPKADLDWLAADLAATDLPAIVFTHVPLDGAAMTGNYYFEANPEYATYAETPAIRKVLRDAGNVVLCVAGHVHWNKANTVDGIPYLSLQSLTESFTTAPEPAGAWSMIEIGDEIRWRGYGADPIDVRLPVRSTEHRVLPPMPSFEVMRQRRAASGFAHPLEGVRGVLFDLDGVVYRGAEVIPGAPALFEYLQSTGRTVGAITNNALSTGAAYAAKLAGMGIDLPAENIITSGWAAARHVTEAKPGAHVFAVGGEALHAELQAAGAVESDRPDFVVAGIDLSLPVQRLSDAAVHVRAGAQFIVTNPDLTVPIETGLRAGAGAVQAFIEAASGGEALVIGKPQPGIFHLALSRLGLAAAETVMVGDTLETDIAGGAAAGLRTVLVESGNADSGNESIVPALRLADVAALHQALIAADANRS